VNVKRVILLLVIAKLTILGLQAQSRKVKMAQKDAEKIEQLQRKFYQKARKEVIKRKRKMQHEATQKMMKEADNRARRFNRSHKDIFIIKFIKKRKSKK